MSRNFVPVATLRELPAGKMLRIELHGRGILLVNLNGEILAVDDLCTHEDASLSTGCLKDGYVKCPLHGSRFDLRTGIPMEEPAEEPLRTYAVQVEEGSILVSPTPD